MNKEKKFRHPFALKRVASYSQYQGGMAIRICGKHRCITASGSFAAFLVEKFEPITVDRTALVFRD